MADRPRLTYASCLLLQAIGTGYIYGYTMTGLPSGTVYPALRRLEREKLIISMGTTVRRGLRVAACT